MRAIHDEVSKATQERLSWQLAAGTMLCETMMRGSRQFADLNLGLVRSTLEQGNFALRQLLSARDVRQFLTLAAAQMHPNALRGLDYGYYCASITAETQAGMIKALGGGVEESNREWRALAGMLANGGPADWKNTLLVLKDFVESACRFPADLARAARLSLNINMPPSETGKLRIAYTDARQPGR